MKPAVLVLIVALGAPAAVSEAGRCFCMSQMRVTKALNEQVVYAKARGKIYRLGMAPNCKGLASGGFAVGSKGHDSVCNPQQLKVMMKAHRQECPVQTITILTPAQTKALAASAIPVERQY